MRCFRVFLTITRFSEDSHTASVSFTRVGVRWAVATPLLRARSVSAHRMVDHHRGRIPEIRTASDSILYYIDVVDGSRRPRLIIRCDANGDVWAALARPWAPPRARRSH